MKNLDSLSAFALAPAFYDSFLLKDALSNKARFKSMQPRPTAAFPAVNIQSDEHGFVLELAAPGISKEQLSIQFDKDRLTIAYQAPEAQVNGNYSLKEFSLQSFSRSFAFAKQLIDEEHIVAKYENGILRLELPRREEAKPKAPRQITIG